MRSWPYWAGGGRWTAASSWEYGTAGKREFWIGRQTPGGGFRESPVAFAAQDRRGGAGVLRRGRRSAARAVAMARVSRRLRRVRATRDGSNVEAVRHAPEP